MLATVDEENTACANNRLSYQQIAYKQKKYLEKPKFKFFEKAVGITKWCSPHPSPIGDTFSAGEG